jgi:hypothetical protein
MSYYPYDNDPSGTPRITHDAWILGFHELTDAAQMWLMFDASYAEDGDVVLYNRITGDWSLMSLTKFNDEYEWA